MAPADEPTHERQGERKGKTERERERERERKTHNKIELASMVPRGTAGVRAGADPLRETGDLTADVFREAGRILERVPINNYSTMNSEIKHRLINEYPIINQRLSNNQVIIKKWLSDG